MSDLAPKGPQKNFEDIKKIDDNSIEYWEARELMPFLEYTDWRNFVSVIDKAKDSCSNSGQKVNNHFVSINKMIKIATGTNKEATRLVSDYKLSRYACYLIAQNGDSTKRPIAIAQSYFAIQTRKQEIFQQLSEEEKRLFIRDEVKDHNKKLFNTAKLAGVSNFGRFNNAGYEGLYGMRKDQIQLRKRIGKDDVLDRAGTTELAANLFRITQTDERIKNDKIIGDFKASNTHLNVGKQVRHAIREIGGTMPENFPAEEHIKKIEQKRKKLLNSSKKNRNLR